MRESDTIRLIREVPLAMEMTLSIRAYVSYTPMVILPMFGRHCE